MSEPVAPANFWEPGFWADGFWEALFWSEEPAAQQQIGGRKKHDPLIQQVLDKWEYLDDIKRRDKPEEPNHEPQAIDALAVDTPEELGQVFSPIALEFPSSLKAKPLPRAPKPLAPSDLEMVRDAIERDDEEALALILAQL